MVVTHVKAFLKAVIIWLLLTIIFLTIMILALNSLIPSDTIFLLMTFPGSPLLSFFVLFSSYRIQRYQENAKAFEIQKKVRQMEIEQELEADRTRKQEEARKLVAEEKQKAFEKQKQQEREQMLIEEEERRVAFEQQQKQHEKEQKEREIAYFKRLRHLEEIGEMDPIEFEKLVGQLFKSMGYTVQYTPGSGDEGIDLFVQKDTRRAVVQCKRYKNNVGQPIVRDLYGAMIHNHADEAYLVTTGNISMPAQKWAEGKQIHLVDGIALMEWLSTFKPDEVL